MEACPIRPGYTISRVIRGGWQLAGGHGAVARESAVADLIAAFDGGITAFDCADIYTGVEEIFGAFRRELRRSRGAEALARLKIHTKCVPDLDLLPHLTKAHVRAIVDRSLQRLGVERLDLVQFHWWDYAIEGWREAALWLDELRQEGKIDLVGGTNFDTAHVADMLALGVPLATMQVQYSLIDRRPASGLADLCHAHNVHLLCYGSAAGGFFTEKWLGATEPREPFENRSLRKYKLIIDDFGGWDLFQELLRALEGIAIRHGVDIATVASRAVLDWPGVAAVIVGARDRAHLAANLRIASLRLTDRDREEMARIERKRRGPQGDVFALERDRTGRHGAIMKYNLNTGAK